MTGVFPMMRAAVKTIATATEQPIESGHVLREREEDEEDEAGEDGLAQSADTAEGAEQGGAGGRLGLGQLPQTRAAGCGGDALAETGCRPPSAVRAAESASGAASPAGAPASGWRSGRS